MRVMVVWEPILPTDWEPPTTSVLSRIHNPGVTQFWDHDHLIAHVISSELESDLSAPKPRCCLSKGNLWDFAGVYPKGALWQDSPPKPVFGDGPVANVQQALRRALTTLLTQKNK